ncbi:MAG: photosynthetic protein synthase I [Halobacteriovoraceae bacterium]|nr:photosynthetic protein synthase I [Halobacteriovoraceae bacterium]|tara:strand:+ start:1318 stop:2148 length:831 start_codon:yes stop_codon:yes gene_type:complete
MGVLSVLACSAFAIGNNNPKDLNSQAASYHQEMVVNKIGIDQNLGDKIDLNNTFTDELGNQVALKKYFNEKPVMMALVYYECPTLCSLHLNGMIDTFKRFEWDIGDKFEFVVVSIDPQESSKLAEKKLASYLEEYGRPQTRDGWHFLTGSEENIKKLANEVGFRYTWNAREKQWAHGAASYILTPDGELSYYHMGIQIQPRVLRLSLVEAADNKIGSLVDQALLMCLQYDPDKKTYAFYALNLVRFGGGVMLLVLGFFLFRFWRKESKNNTTKQTT